MLELETGLLVIVLVVVEVEPVNLKYDFGVEVVAFVKFLNLTTAAVSLD